ncbi:MAG: YIP1 family protein [Terriglobales bacterium]
MADFASSQPLPAAGAAPQSPRRMSSAARIFGAFYSPAETFQDIARAPHFVLCWVVMVLASIFTGYTALHRFGAYELAQQLLTANPRTQAMPADQLQKLVTGTARFLPLQLYAITPVVVIVVLLVLAAIFLGAENFLLGQQVKYKGMLAAVSHAMLPVTLYTVAGAVVLWLRADPSTAQFRNLLGSNPAYYLDPSSLGPVLNALLQRLDLFSFWAIGLLALGMVKLGQKVKYGGALAVVAGLWVLYVLLFVGVAALT